MNKVSTPAATPIVQELKTFTPPPMDKDIDLSPAIARDLNLPVQSVRQVLVLFAEGGTVPFIARYRKEQTGSLDEVQIRDIGEREVARKELETRRKTVVETIASQGKLTKDLYDRVMAADTRTLLEDLYLPYKPRRRTKAQTAREAGLEPLALLILEQGSEGDPAAIAATFINAEKGVPDVETALKMACDIVAETMVENADARREVRQVIQHHGMYTAVLKDSPKEGEVAKKTKFDQYKDFGEALKTIPSHRFLAIRRGENEGILRSNVHVEENQVECLKRELETLAGLKSASPFAKEMQNALRVALMRLRIQIETDVIVETKTNADEGAIAVFATNLKALLLSAPMGQKGVIGIDPGLRTGCKVAVVNEVGTFIEDDVLYLVGSDAKKAQAETTFLSLVTKHKPVAIAVGNGTGNREAENFCKSALKVIPESERPFVVSVNEAGASVYSASAVARDEFPTLDLTVRGAISIARRLQDPLAELVKIDPKSIGVGQYQHDVNQVKLVRKLGEVIEDCVNAVGVELNTASAPLLSHVSGISANVAKNIVEYRNNNGAFPSRKAVLKVSGLGPKSFEQAAGFLRLRDGKHPLDNSAVHPERYALVETMAKDLEVTVDELLGNAALARSIKIENYISGDIGKPTLLDIVEELQKPGRDPRASFEPPAFREDVTKISDLKEGMVLEGVVTNVTAFGAFVDIGVHQDGLVHISCLADRFVSDPNEVAKAGQRMKVRVLEIDIERNRISLSARLDDSPTGTKDASSERPKGDKKKGNNRSNNGRQNKNKGQSYKTEAKHNPFAALLKNK